MEYKDSFLTSKINDYLKWNDFDMKDEDTEEVAEVILDKCHYTEVDDIERFINSCVVYARDYGMGGLLEASDEEILEYNNA